MKYSIALSPSDHIYSVQQDFSTKYPYLRMEFFRGDASQRKLIPHSSLLQAAGLTKEGKVEISDSMPISAFESMMKDEFGVTMQILRQSGVIWLETTMTDSWTLAQQNEHGRELSKKITEDHGENDYDLDRGNL